MDGRYVRMRQNLLGRSTERSNVQPIYSTSTNHNEEVLRAYFQKVVGFFNCIWCVRLCQG